MGPRMATTPRGVATTPVVTPREERDSYFAPDCREAQDRFGSLGPRPAVQRMHNWSQDYDSILRRAIVRDTHAAPSVVPKRIGERSATAAAVPAINLSKLLSRS